MKNNWRKITAMVATAAFATIGISSISPAEAADPYVGAKITLVHPVLTPLNTSEAVKNQAMADGWVKNTWFGAGLVYQRTWLPVGSTFKLVYNVVDKKNKPLAGQTVILRCNKQYSVSTAQIKCNGQPVKAATGSADGGRVSAVTDVYGNVTFTVQNIDNEGETQPAAWTDAPVISEDGLDDYHAQFLPQIAGEKPDTSVITEFHFYTPTVTTPAMPEEFPVIPTELRSAALLTGTAKVGSTLTAAPGFFTGNPLPTLKYVWGRCTIAGKTTLTTAKPPTSAKCVAIAGKTSKTYKLVAADKGKYIRVAVTATNTAATKYSISKTTTIVK